MTDRKSPSARFESISTPDSTYEYKCALTPTSRIICELYAEKSMAGALMSKLFIFVIGGTRCSKSAIIDIVKDNKSDREIINGILNLRRHAPKSSTAIADEYDERSGRQTAAYDRIFTEHKEILQSAGSAPTFLDIGSDKGIMTNLVAGRIRAMSTVQWDVYGADINNWGIHSSQSARVEEYKRRGMNFVLIDYEQTRPIILGGEHHIATASQTLHHAAAHVPALMREFQRLKIKYMLLREHNCTDELVGKLISVEHLVYAILNDRLSYIDSLPMCHGIYRPYTGWDRVFGDAGYDCMDNGPPTISGVTRSYFRTYKRRE